MEHDTNIWTTIIQVLLGGLLALLGVATGPAVTQLLTDRTSQKAKRTQKYEDLISAVYEYDHWLAQRASAAFEGRDIDSQPPIQRAILLCSLHFPELLPHVQKVENDAGSYIMWILGVRKKRLENNLTGVNDDMAKTYDPYRSSFAVFQREAFSFVQRNKMLF
ncbi:hypothetical protein NKH73_14125 [Mesorhizobium sp. M0938]|uniref:hypothetical protein n=1 Tax=unclassified Mesorhizobium TaxID=325217 RepID=UPI003339EEFD